MQVSILVNQEMLQVYSALLIILFIKTAREVFF